LLVSAVTKVCWSWDLKADPLFIMVKFLISRERFLTFKLAHSGTF
jgi:hypothetical protein